MEEPGIDRERWEAEWQALEPQLADAPAETLPELDDLVARLMQARGLALVEREGEELPEREATREFAEAHRIAALVDEGGDVDPGDVAHAIDGYRSLYRELVAFGPEPGSPA